MWWLNGGYNKNELMKLGYGKYQSERIIRQAKAIMVSKAIPITKIED